MSMERHFALFPKLPTELRLKVWRSALPLFPRILEAKPKLHTGPLNTVYNDRFPEWTITPTARTTLLSINHESRNEVKKYYAAPFDAATIIPTSKIASLYFNYSVDTLYLDLTNLAYIWPRIYTFEEMVGSLFGAAFPEAQRQLRSLAGTEDLWDLIDLENFISDTNGTGNFKFGTDAIESFPNMEEHIIVFEKGLLSKGDRLVRFEVVDDIESAKNKLYLEQFPRIKGVKVKVCRSVGRQELRLLDWATKWDVVGSGERRQ